MIRNLALGLLFMASSAFSHPKAFPNRQIVVDSTFIADSSIHLENSHRVRVGIGATLATAQESGSVSLVGEAVVKTVNIEVENDIFACGHLYYDQDTIFQPG